MDTEPPSAERRKPDNGRIVVPGYGTGSRILKIVLSTPPTA
jgi:hypothetical protein